MATESTRFAGRLLHRYRVRRRLAELDYLLRFAEHIRVPWGQERAYIERTVRLDWVDPNRPRVRPASECLLPPPSQSR